MTSDQQPNDAIPSAERQAKLEAAYEANVAAEKQPYERVVIRTRGELRWIMEKRGWTSELPLTSGKKAANLVGADLAHTYLGNVCLTGADLAGASLAGANLSGAFLSWANLSNADLAEADLSDAMLLEAYLDGADLMAITCLRADLIGASLVGAILGLAKLSDTSLFNADMSNAKLTGADLTGTELRDARLTGANLRSSRMDSRTQLEGIILDTKTLLADVIWGDAPLTQIAWERLPESGDEADAHRYAKSDERGENCAIHVDDFAAAARAYRQLTVALRSQGMNDDADRYAYRAQLMQREMYRWGKRWGACAMSWLLFLVSGYGYRLWRIFATYAAVVLVFSVVYWTLGVHSFPHESGIQALWDSLLVSLSAIHGRTTFEQLGAWTPAAWTAAVESVTGIVIEGVFVAMLIQRYFAR